MSYNKSQKLQDNISAIYTVLKLRREGRQASAGEREILRKYSGFGGLKFILNSARSDDDREFWKSSDRPFFSQVRDLYDIIKEFAADAKQEQALLDSIKRSVNTAFYTPGVVIDGIVKGIAGGKISVGTLLDPSAGIGKFGDAFRAKNDGLQVTAFEKDLLTGYILQALHTGDAVTVDGFETIKADQKGSFDLVTSNIPFGNISVFDPEFRSSDNKVRRSATSAIHNYFFLKSLDMAREGGLVAFITSRGVMDSPSNGDVRREMLSKANLISALRLPDGMFRDEAGTEVGSDLIVLQKDTWKNGLSAEEEDFVSTVQTMDGIIINGYYDSRRECVLTSGTIIGTDPYGKPAYVYPWDKGLYSLSEALSGRLTYDIVAHQADVYYADTMSKVKQPVAAPAVKPAVKTKPKAQSGPVQLDLFSVWDEQEAQAEPEQPRMNMEPRPFEGEIRPFYRDGVVVEDPANGQLGVLSVSGGDVFTPLSLDQDSEGRMRLYLRIRDTYQNLYLSEAELREEQTDLRADLNRYYDDFVRRYGCLNERRNFRVIITDMLGRDTLTLENAVGRSFVKADTFDRPVSFVSYDIDHVDTPEDALFASLNRNGKVDLDYMSLITGSAVEELKDQLKGSIYYMPDGHYEIASKVLSGNVYEKLAYLDDALELAKEHADDPAIVPALQETRDAVQNVVPQQIPFDDIGLQFGERWIPVKYYEDYVGKLFDTEMEIHYAEHIDEYSLKADDRYNLKIREEYCVHGEYKDFDGMALLAHAFHDTTPDIQKCIGYDENGEDLKGSDMEKIQLAQSKIQEIRDGFTEYLTNLPREDREELQQMYNRKFNCFVKAQYDGGHQVFPGIDLKALASPRFNVKNIYGSQKDCVWMLLQNGGGICDHEVGTGKTLIMCMAAHEMHRLGLANKPMIIALKANVAEIAATYQAAFPDDKILYASEKDYSPANRVQFFNRIKNNDYACVVMSHDQFGMIPQSMEIQRQILADEIRDIDEAIDVLRQQGGNVSGRMLTGLEKRKENLHVKMQNMMIDMANKKDDFVDFGMMGIDHIFVDESHQFKNLMFTTRHQRVSGLGNPSGSQKALNLLYAIRTIQGRTGKDLGATFLSGTTISNSLTELYLLFKYLRPNAMARQGIHSFDAWAAVYAKKTSDYEFSVTNAVVQKERFRYFVKVPELATFYNEITDYRTGEDVGLDRPDMNVMLHNIKPTADQQDFNERLVQFAQTGEGELIYRAPLSDREMKGKMLIATDASRKAALDMRLVSPGLFGDDPDNKASHCARLVSQYYHKYNDQKGTQFIFSDLSTYKPGEWNVFQEIKDKLVSDYGIPENEIRFIQEAKNQKQRNAIIDAMNRGDVRVLFGSTTTLGTGVNAQKRAVAVHHIDIPWRPSDLEQRDGRARRSGNEVAKLYADNNVDVIIYAVERTLDSYKFNLLQNKQLFINQLKTNSLGTRVIDEGAMDEENGMNFAEYVAILSGNDDLLQKAKLEKKILALESERKTYMQARRDTEWRLDNAKGKLDKNEVIIRNMTEDNERYLSLRKTTEEGTPLPGLVMADVPEFGADGSYNIEGMGVTLQEAGRVIGNKDRQMGTVYGFPLMVESLYMWDDKTNKNVFAGNKFWVQGHYQYEHNNGKLAMSKDNRAAAVCYGVNALEKIPGYIRQYEERNVKLRQDIAEYERIAGKAWGKEEELKSLRHDMEELERKIQDSLDKTKASQPKQEEPVFTIYKENRWHKVSFARESMSLVSISEMRKASDGLGRGYGYVHGCSWCSNVLVSEPKIEGEFSYRQGAEEWIRKIIDLQKSRIDDREWLSAKAAEDTNGYVIHVDNEVIFSARKRLAELNGEEYRLQLPEDVREDFFDKANMEDYHSEEFSDNHSAATVARKTLEDYGIDWCTNLSLEAVQQYIDKWKEVPYEQMADKVLDAVDDLRKKDQSLLLEKENDFLSVLDSRASKRFLHRDDSREAMMRVGIYADYLSDVITMREAEQSQQHVAHVDENIGSRLHQEFVEREHDDVFVKSVVVPEDIKEKWSSVDDATVTRLARDLSSRGFDKLYDAQVIAGIRDTDEYRSLQNIFSNYPENISHLEDAGKIARHSRMFLRDYEALCLNAGIPSMVSADLSIAGNDETKESPVLRQFHDLKAKHPDALLLFRHGDFYETYETDAKTASYELGITLTWRDTVSADYDTYKGAMAGFPYHALDTYLPKLIRAGHRVAICDQLEAPSKTQSSGRGITEKVTPGIRMQIVVDGSALTPEEKTMMSQVVADLATGNHLLGLPRPEGYKEFFAESEAAAAALQEGRPLTVRQRDLLMQRASNLYGGVDDLAEDLDMKKDVFISRLSNIIPDNHYNNDLRDGLIEKMRNAGIDVNTNWQEGQRVLQQANSNTRSEHRVGNSLSSVIKGTITSKDVERAMDTKLVKLWLRVKSSDDPATKNLLNFGTASHFIHEFAKARLGIDNKFEPGPNLFNNSWEALEDYINLAKENGLDAAIAGKYDFRYGSEDIQTILSHPEALYSDEEMAAIESCLKPRGFEDFKAVLRSFPEAKEIQAEEERIKSFDNGDAVTKALVLYDIVQRRLHTEYEGDDRFFRRSEYIVKADGTEAYGGVNQKPKDGETLAWRWVLKSSVVKDLLHLIATSPITEKVPLLDMMPSALQRYLTTPSSEERTASLVQLSEKDLDSLYLAAMPDNKQLMRDVLNIIAERRGYTLDSSYQGTSAFNGAAPSANVYFVTKEERLEAWKDGSYEGEMSLADFIESGIDTNDLQWQITDPHEYRRVDVMHRESIDTLRKAVNDGTGMVTMYRSVPSSVKEGQFRNGDWITPSKQYAIENAAIHGWGEDYRIIEQEVPVSDVWWDGNDIAEWGYDDGKDYRYKNTVNNVKSDALIVRDDKGNVILPSQRFDEQKADIRYMLVPDSQSPIFVSNAWLALQKVKQDKATPEQWLKMLEKLGGIKAGEDRWTGLSQWLKDSQEKSLSKMDIAKYLHDNMINVEEVHYIEARSLEDSEQFRAYQREFDDIKAHVNDLYEAADNKYGEFIAEMTEKYGQDWMDQLTDEEDRQERYLLKVREDCDTSYHTPTEIAYDEMISRYGDDWGMAFSYYQEDGQLTIEDEDRAVYFLGEVVSVDRAINGTRLRFTTDELNNKREIALTVPTIESWNSNDEIHFGDADDGRAIAWVRFGDTVTKRPLTDAEVAAELQKLPTADQWEKVDGSNFVTKRDVYFAPGTRNDVGHNYIVDRDGRFVVELSTQYLRHHISSPFNKEGYATLAEAVDAYNRWQVSRMTMDEKVLVIDEIQSKRHQDGREKGYRRSIRAERDAVAKIWSDSGRTDDNAYKRLQALNQELRNWEEHGQWKDNKVPAAPFEKNWQDLCMKRMLRYAAENGYDRVAWLNGEQQADRYDLGKLVDRVTVNAPDDNGKRKVAIQPVEDTSGHVDMMYLSVDKDGIVYSNSNPDWIERHISEVVGKPLADKIMSAEEFTVFEDNDLRVGIYGMKAFYDEMLPSFMNKYGKQWGVHVEDMDIPALQREDSRDGIALHGVKVTEQMKQDVMQGQPMFFRSGERQAYGFVHNGTIYIDPRIATAETPLHEYTHLWAEVLRQRNPQEWQNIVQMMKDTPEVWNYVKQNYPHLKTDDQIADEALAQFSGKRGYQKLQEFVNGQEDKSILDKMMEVLGKFWSHVAEFFGIHYTNKEEVADRILYDLLNEVNPLDYRITAPIVNVENPAVLGENPFARIAADKAFYENFFREQQEKQIESDNFKQWFGDWEQDPENASKMVNKDGTPMVVYHGSYWNPLEEEKGKAVFDDSYGGTASQDNGFFGRGFYFTFGNGEGSRAEASYYGPTVGEYFLNLRRPFMFSETLKTYNGHSAFGFVSEAVEIINIVKHFPEFAKDYTLDLYDGMGEYKGEISLEEFSKMFEDVYKNKEFIIHENVDGRDSNIIELCADPVVLRGTYPNGEDWEYTDYKFRLEMYRPVKSEDERLNFAYYYLSSTKDMYRDNHRDNVVHIPSHMFSELYESEKFTQELKRRGYDGVMQSADGDEVVVFEPNQIKSATDNIGLFSKENNDIRFFEEEQTRSENFKQWFGDWEKVHRFSQVIKSFDLDSLQDEYDRFIADAPGNLRRATRAYDRFVSDKEQRYGDNWSESLTPEEREEEENLSAYRDGFDGDVTDLQEAAFEAVCKNHEHLSEVAYHSNGRISFTYSSIEEFIDNENPEGVSRVVDEEGKPLVVEHGTHADFTEFSMDKIGENSRDNGLFGAGFYFGTKAPAWLNDGSEDYHVMKVYLDIKRPFEISDGVKDIYTEIKDRLDSPAMRGLTLTGLNGKQIQVGEYINVIKAVDDLISSNPVHVNARIAHDDELQSYHPNDRLRLWREHEISRISGMGVLPMSWQALISEQLGSYLFTAAAIQDGYDGVIVDRGEDYKEYVAFEPSQIKSATENVGLFSKENNDIRLHLEDSRESGTARLISMYYPAYFNSADLKREVTSLGNPDNHVLAGYEDHQTGDYVFVGAAADILSAADRKHVGELFNGNDLSRDSVYVLPMRTDAGRGLFGMLTAELVHKNYRFGILEGARVREIVDRPESLDVEPEEVRPSAEKKEPRPLRVTSAVQLDLFSDRDFVEEPVTKKAAVKAAEPREREAAAERQAFDPTQLTMRRLAKDEKCYVERRYTEMGYFSFVGGEHIESNADVAYIFRSLEDKSVENAFICMVKDGRPTVIHLGIGDATSVMAPLQDALLAYKALKPDKIWFIHNHPSGNLKVSREDYHIQERMETLFGRACQPGIIINTTSGKFTAYTSHNVLDGDNRISDGLAGTEAVKTYSFDRSVFNKDWDPIDSFKGTSYADVAKFVSSHRLGEHEKLSLLVMNQSGSITGNVFLPWTNIKDVCSKDGVDLISKTVLQMGGNRCLLYGSEGAFEGKELKALPLLQKNLRNYNIALHDVTSIERSLRLEGIIASEPVEVDVAREAAVRRPLTVEDREAGGALVDQLTAMGIAVSTDNRKNRRVLKDAQSDQSEVGKVRHMKTASGENYGFAYKGDIYLDLRKIDAELPLHEYAHLWCESMRRINPDNWIRVVIMMQQDSDTWKFVRSAYPELTDADDLAEEVIAHYSGKRGAEKLQAELQRMTPRDDNYNSRWNNIFKNVSKAIQDFWKHVGDSLNIHYSSKEDIADQILNDFAQQVNPVKKVERWLQERDKEYADAVEQAVQSGKEEDWAKARAIFFSALEENVGNGVTPFMAVDGYRGKLDRLAHAVKDENNTEAIQEAVRLMAPRVPANAVLVPAPGHVGYATDTLALAKALGERCDVPVADVLKSDPRESQYEYKYAHDGKAMDADSLGIRMEGDLPEGRLPFVIDNVVHTGNTAEACIKALGHGIVYSLASAVSQSSHVASLKSAETAVYDKEGRLIPLSERFELKNRYVGRVMRFKPMDTAIYQEPSVIQGLEDYDVEDVKSYVENSVLEMLEDSFPDDDIAIKKLTVIGSRARGEGRADSDLDILLEYEGSDVREDALYNAIKELELDFDGIAIDVNPINARYSLTTEQWLARDARWREEDNQNAIINQKNTNMNTSAIESNLKVLAERLLPGNFSRVRFMKPQNIDHPEAVAVGGEISRREDGIHLFINDRDTTLDGFIASGDRNEVSDVYRSLLEYSIASRLGNGKGMNFPQGTSVDGYDIATAAVVNDGLRVMGSRDGEAANATEYITMEGLAELDQLVEQRLDVDNMRDFDPVAFHVENYQRIMLAAAQLKEKTDSPSQLYDELNNLAMMPDMNISEWARRAALALNEFNPESTRLNEMTESRYLRFVHANNTLLSSEQMNDLAAGIRKMRSSYVESQVIDQYDKVISHYAVNTPVSDTVEGRALEADLSRLLQVKDGAELMNWLRESPSHDSSEPLQLLKTMLATKSVYDADHILSAIRERDLEPEHRAQVEAQLPKNLLEQHYAFVMSYYIGNAREMGEQERSLFHRLDNATTAEALQRWASEIRVGRALQGLDLPAAVRDEVDELARQIAETNDEVLSTETIKGISAIGIVNDLRKEALDRQYKSLTDQYPDDVILFRSGKGMMSAYGSSYSVIKEQTGWEGRRLDDNSATWLNITTDGYSVLAEKDVNLRVVTPDVSIRPLAEKYYDELAPALQTIDYSLSLVNEKPVLVETDGSLKIDDFKVKTLDFHSTGLTAINEAGELLTIRDIPKNYYHPQGTLVIADYISGHRETVERSLGVSVEPTIAHLSEEIDRGFKTGRFGAEINISEDGRGYVDIFDPDTNVRMGNPKELSQEETAAYKALDGIEDISKRSDLVISMAHKYFGEQLNIKAAHDRVVQAYDTAGMAHTPLFLINEVEVRKDGVVQSYNAMTVEPPMILLYKTMDDAQKGLLPSVAMLSDLEPAVQKQVLSDLSEELSRMMKADSQAKAAEEFEEPSQDVQIPKDVSVVRNNLEDVLKKFVAEQGADIPVSNRVWTAKYDSWADVQKIAALVAEDAMRSVGKYDEDLANSTSSQYVSPAAEQYGRDITEKVKLRIAREQAEMDNVVPYNQDVQSTIVHLLEKDDRFRYKLLDQMTSEVKHFLGDGNRQESGLWAKNAKDQINIMDALMRSLPECPVWISSIELVDYADKMGVGEVYRGSAEEIHENHVEEQQESKVYTAEEMDILKGALADYLKKKDSDYYHTDLQIDGAVRELKSNAVSSLKSSVSIICEKMLNTAEEKKPGLLASLLPVGMDKDDEVVRMSDEAIGYAEGVLYNKQNDMEVRLSEMVVSLNQTVKEFNVASKAVDASYDVMKKPVTGYDFEKQNDDSYALLTEDADGRHYGSSYMTARQLLSKMESIQKDLKEKTTALQASVDTGKAEKAQPEHERDKQSGRDWSHYDYSQNRIPEGVKVENAKVTRIPPKEGEKYATFILSADVLGKHYRKEMWGNDIKAFYEKDAAGNRTNRVTLDQLVAKYFGKQFADSMSIGSVQEAEHVLAEQKEGKEQAVESQEQKQQAQADREKEAAQEKAAQEKKAQEAARKKAEEEKKNEKKEKVPALVLQTSLLIGALAAAKDHDGQWLNRDGKLAPDFVQKGQAVSPFNALMMGLHSDANGYKTNDYTTFNAARGNGYSVKGGQVGLPFNWYNWDRYVNRFNSNEVIGKEDFNKLAPEEKELYKVLRTKEERSVFNIDQTTMSLVKTADYDAIVKQQGRTLSNEDLKSADEGVSFVMSQLSDVKAKHPDALILFRNGDFYECYQDDAEKASQLLGITVTDNNTLKDGEGNAVRYAGFPYHALDSNLPKLIRAGQRVAICDKLEDPRQMKRFGLSDEIYGKAHEIVTALKEDEKVVVDPYLETGYDAEKDILRFNERRMAPFGQEVSTAIKSLNDTYRAAIAYTGGEARLNRVASTKILPDDAHKYDRLVQELAAGVLMSRQGLPAALSKDSLALVPYWERELKESPSMMDNIERDVNNAVEVLVKIKNGETVDYSAIRGQKAFEAVRPKLYTIASELASIPSTETKEVVVVKDMQKMTAAVILPAGASAEVDNQVPGMSKNRYIIALRKQGFENVEFFNAGGSLGLNQSNEFFADKTVEVAKLKQYELVTTEVVDLTKEIERTSKVDIEKMQITSDDKGHRMLYVKPAVGDPFTVYPEPSDVKRFFESIHTPEFNDVREQLAQKYYALVLRHPDLKREVLMPDVKGIDLSRISNVNITKDKYKENTTIIFATIDGERQKPKELTKLQAERVWLVNDQDMYKLAVAAQMWQEKLSVGNGQSEDGQVQFRDHHEGSGVDSGTSAAETPSEGEQEAPEEKRGGGIRL